MRCYALLLAALVSSGCTLFRRPFRPEHALKEEEVAKLPYPSGLLESGRMQVSAQVSAAVSLAFDDLLPRDVNPPRNATSGERCLY